MSARKILSLLFVMVLLTTLCPPAAAQPRRPGQPFQPNRPGQPFQQPGGPSDAQQAGATACGGLAIFFALVMVVVGVAASIFWIFVVVWAAKDAKSRGMDNGALWVVLILFTGVIGLLIYIVSRPQGNLYSCEECGNKRLRESRRCPHCRVA